MVGLYWGVVGITYRYGGFELGVAVRGGAAVPVFFCCGARVAPLIRGLALCELRCLACSLHAWYPRPGLADIRECWVCVWCCLHCCQLARWGSPFVCWFVI